MEVPNLFPTWGRDILNPVIVVKSQVMNMLITSVSLDTDLFQREKHEYSELREDFKTFRGILSFREIRVNTHHFL